jgi:hypothetical protein
MWVRFGVGGLNESALRCMVRFRKDMMFWGDTGPYFKSELVLCSDGVSA